MPRRCSHHHHRESRSVSFCNKDWVKKWKKKFLMTQFRDFFLWIKCQTSKNCWILNFFLKNTFDKISTLSPEFCFIKIRHHKVVTGWEFSSSSFLQQLWNFRSQSEGIQELETISYGDSCCSLDIFHAAFKILINYRRPSHIQITIRCCKKLSLIGSS